ncbi:hypothetical protein EDB19DRAFT_1725206 [Suillus lakei]|nr:hypothetical protein EDB19DRAFT_1725206 [Suillus lakei]
MSTPSLSAGDIPLCAALPVQLDGSFSMNHGTIGHPFVPKPCPADNGEIVQYQTIFVDEGVSVDELRVKDYQLGGRPPSYPPEPEFCGVPLVPEQRSLFDINESQFPHPHPNGIEESQSPPPHPNALWYDDGSVVLKAGDSLFRVHRSILSKKSSVFATVLLQSQSESTETHEGCPAVSLGDDAEELRQLLLTIYETSYFEDNAQYLVYLCAILRLSTKYQMERLRVMALQQLKRGVPSTLASFDDPGHRHDRANAQRNVLAIINIARETNCLELLPCAYYYCSRLSTSTILQGNGEVVLASPDITACILGKDQLLNMQRQTTHSFLYTLPKPDSGGSCCKERGRSDRLLLQYLQHQDLTTPCTFELFTDWKKIGMCKSCAPLLQHIQSRRKAWVQLPRIFGLESWEKIVA